METLGLPAPAFGPPAPQPGGAKVFSIGGVVRVGNQAAALQDSVADTRKAMFEAQQATPGVTGLAGHLRTLWTDAKDARITVEKEMIEALLARRGQYTDEKIQQIREQRQPLIYMMVAATKMRQIEALLRDVFIGAGDEKPWTLRPGPVPELPPSMVQDAVMELMGEIEAAMASGFPPTMAQAQERMREIKDELQGRLMEEAREKMQLMEDKMEDQLLQGGFLAALEEFIVDFATFKTAFMAGPVVRSKDVLQWGPNGEMVVSKQLVPEFERVDPFDVYPARFAKSLQHGPLIRRHRMERSALEAMIGVPGFSEAAIREVLERFPDKGFREWTTYDVSKEQAEGREGVLTTQTGLIDAIQCWCEASGKMLRDWGMSATDVPDVTKQYRIEAWMIDSIVIKAVLNADPLARRPLFGASFARVPGSVWGSAPYDLLKDCQTMCNGAARALAANMGISSGPQVGLISNRLPSGADITEMFPWKIWQFESDPMGSTAAPITFFQPQSNANELMAVYERYSILADEAVGVPRYMAGFETAGAGRTASGMSMMIGNASKVIRQAAGATDTGVIEPMLLALHYYNMRYGTDPDLKGDINPQALGALALVTKEAAQVRTNEFLTATNNPVDMQILGIEGRAELLRSAVKRLDVNSDRVVPPLPVMRQRFAEAQMQQLAMAQQNAGGQAPAAKPGGEQLMNGAPTTDNFSPSRKPGRASERPGV